MGEMLVEELLATDAQPSNSQLIVVEGGRGGVTRDSLRELWQSREVVSAFAIRKVKVKYKQAAIGIGWAVIQPLFAALLFSVVLGRLAHIKSEGAPYLVFAFAGMVAWNFFSSAVSNAMESVVADQAMLRKVYFPREVFPIAAVGATLVDLVPSLVTLVVFTLSSGLRPHLTWLVLPLLLVLLTVSALALGLALACMNVYYRDVRYLVPFLIQLGLFATPVAYSLSLVPARWRTLYEAANPVAAVIDGFRRVLLHASWPLPVPTLAAFASSTVGLVLAYLLFKRVERGFADRL